MAKSHQANDTSIAARDIRWRREPIRPVLQFVNKPLARDPDSILTRFMCFVMGGCASSLN